MKMKKKKEKKSNIMNDTQTNNNRE